MTGSLQTGQPFRWDTPIFTLPYWSGGDAFTVVASQGRLMKGGMGPWPGMPFLPWGDFVGVDFRDRVIVVRRLGAQSRSGRFDELSPGLQRRLGRGWARPTRVLLRLAYRPTRPLAVSGQVLPRLLEHGASRLDDVHVVRNSTIDVVSTIYRAVRHVDPNVAAIKSGSPTGNPEDYMVEPASSVLVVRTGAITEAGFSRQLLALG